MSYSELPAILAFFVGGPGTDPKPSKLFPKRPMGFDATARALAHNSQCWAAKVYRLEDVQAFFFRMLIEWARLADWAEGVDEKDLDYVYSERDEYDPPAVGKEGAVAHEVLADTLDDALVNKRFRG
jgi:beta-1,2-xylosyltransferase